MLIAMNNNRIVVATSVFIPVPMLRFLATNNESGSRIINVKIPASQSSIAGKRNVHGHARMWIGCGSVVALV